MMFVIFFMSNRSGQWLVGIFLYWSAWFGMTYLFQDGQMGESNTNGQHARRVSFWAMSIYNKTNDPSTSNLYRIKRHSLSRPRDLKWKYDYLSSIFFRTQTKAVNNHWYLYDTSIASSGWTRCHHIPLDTRTPTAETTRSGPFSAPIRRAGKNAWSSPFHQLKP